MTRPPLLFRLLLSTMFLPIMIALGVVWYMILFYEPAGMCTDQSVVLGIRTVWCVWAALAFPFVLGLWILWSGNWRRPVLTAVVVYVSGFFIAVFGTTFEYIKFHTPPEKRMISLSGTQGTDVYCNGVHLGQLPLEIRVDELTAKVPEWNTPPEQRWYEAELNQGLCTWLPWDDFRKERFEASKELFGVNSKQTVGNTPRAMKARQELLAKHDANCRYWWSCRFGESQMAFSPNRNPSYLNRPFDAVPRYDSYAIFSDCFSPSVGFHIQLLVDVLPELTPEEKTDWDRYVLKYWSLLGFHLKSVLGQMAANTRNRDKNDPLAELYETALHSTALMKYNLSDPPTEEECRRLLEEWVKGSMESNAFLFIHNSHGGIVVSQPIVLSSLLIPDGIENTMRKPVAEQWKKNKYRIDTGWAPVAYFSWKDKSPDYFADFARFSATTQEARISLLENESPLTVPLFKTLLHRRSLSECLPQQIHLYPGQIDAYSLVDNPLVESTMREYIVRALSDPKHNEHSREKVEQAVMSAIFHRIARENVDKEELDSWVASLPLPVSSRNHAQRFLRLRSQEFMTFADQLQQAAGQQSLVETELTLDEVLKWFAENPEGDLTLFLSEHEADITVSGRLESRRPYYQYYDAGMSGFGDEQYVYASENRNAFGSLPQWFVLALLKSDTPEGNPQVRDLIRRIWTRNTNVVEGVFIHKYGGGDGVSFSRNMGGDFRGGSDHLPDYILDLYLLDKKEQPDAPQQPRSNWSLAPIFAWCDSPKASEILEKWVAESEGKPSRPQLERWLDVWRTRSALKQRKMEVFRDMVAHRINPDDLLMPQAPWVWKDGQYVRE